jgi:hypothetical protein
MSNLAEVPVTQLALKIQRAIDHENISVNQLARDIDMTYEYTRRLVKGINTPSKLLLKTLAHRFAWDFDEVYRTLVQDKFRLANGKAGAVAQEFDPEVEPFEKAWHFLEDGQKEILLAQLNLFLAQNRRSIRGGGATNSSPTQLS